jgi:thiamine-phosphate pyrophosphorylase
MHFYNFKFYCFIDSYNKNLINNLTKNVSIIYRNYSVRNNLSEINKIKENCRKKGLKFYLSNNVKLAIKLNLDGAYIPSFNKDLNFNAYELKKKFTLLGSAHSLKEIRFKEKQRIDHIFLSPIFKTNKKKKLGIYRFLALRDLTRKKIIGLGGIKKDNLNLLKKLKISEVASISLFHQ